MPYININHTKYYYEDTGAGAQTLLFGHSLLFNLRMFDDQVARFKGKYRCICFDFKGHGKSGAPEDGYDLDTLTEDIATLINELGISPCHFVGFSMGGMVGMRLAIKYPGLIRSLILIDTSSEPETPGGMLRNKAMLLVAKYIGLKPLAGKVMRMFFGPDFLKDPDRRDLRATWKKHFTANDPTGIVRAARGVLFREAVTPELGRISCPATIMVGEKDRLTDISKAEIIRDHIPRAVMEIIPRAAHMSTVEEPGIVNRIMEDHLGQIPT